MFRTVVMLSLLAVGCDVGEVPLEGGSDGGALAACVDRVASPPAAYEHGPAGTRAGEGCIVSGCHLVGGGGSPFTAAGTVYAADKTTPNAGATIRLISGSTTLSAVADTAGNFYFRQSFTVPAKTDATACPDTTPMVGLISTGGGNCNGGSCHGPGSTQGVIKF